MSFILQIWNTHCQPIPCTEDELSSENEVGSEWNESFDSFCCQKRYIALAEQQGSYNSDLENDLISDLDCDIDDISPINSPNISDESFVIENSTSENELGISLVEIALAKYEGDSNSEETDMKSDLDFDISDISPINTPNILELGEPSVMESSISENELGISLVGKSSEDELGISIDYSDVPTDDEKFNQAIGLGTLKNADYEIVKAKMPPARPAKDILPCK